MRSITVDVTTAADGSATKYSPRISGKIYSVSYLKTDFADGVDFAITADRSGGGIGRKATSMPPPPATLARPRTPFLASPQLWTVRYRPSTRSGWATIASRS